VKKEKRDAYSPELCQPHGSIMEVNGDQMEEKGEVLGV
jgi:hypothetical protein